jgi:hypothetical protein
LRSTTCTPRKWKRGSSPDGYLETSVEQLATLLFAKRAREVARPKKRAARATGADFAF